MAKAAWCAQCGAYVWLDEAGGDANGHDASQMSNIYEAEPGPAAGAAGVAAGDQVSKVADDLGQGLNEAGAQLSDLGKKAWSWGKQQAKSDDYGGNQGFGNDD
jgi:hypothetical protein